jgi:FixJ family two-component response regulator
MGYWIDKHGHMIVPIVYVVDDDPTILESVQKSFRSVGVLTRTYHSAEAFILDYSSQHAACLILDLQMPGMAGMELIEWLRVQHIHLPVIVLSGHGNIPAVVESMKLGVAEFLEKPVDDRLLVKRVRELLKLEADGRDERAQAKEIRDSFATLTAREKEVVELLANGLSSKQIAAMVGITLKTVENHRSRVLAKTRATNVASLVRMKMIAAKPPTVA